MSHKEQEQDNLAGFESFLEDEAEDGVEYVKPKYVELSLAKERKLELRALLKTLNEYGLSQRDRLFLIYIMALEFESREAMLAVTDAVSVADQYIPKKIIGRTQQPKIITNFS